MSQRTFSSLAIPLVVTLGCGGDAPPRAREPQASFASTTVVDDAAGGLDSTSSSEPSSAGPRPPDFELETLDGDSVRLSDHLGKKVILIDFWATFCAPCLAAMPHLEALYQRHKDDGFLVLGVSIDGPDSIAQVRAEVRKLGVTFPILLDTETSVVQRYNPKTSAPYSVLIDRSGRVLKKKEGYSTGDGSGLDQDVATALAPTR